MVKRVVCIEGAKQRPKEVIFARTGQVSSPSSIPNRCLVLGLPAIFVETLHLVTPFGAIQQIHSKDMMTVNLSSPCQAHHEMMILTMIVMDVANLLQPRTLVAPTIMSILVLAVGGVYAHALMDSSIKLEITMMHVDHWGVKEDSLDHVGNLLPPPMLE
jgi:hypothetical protein